VVKFGLLGSKLSGMITRGGDENLWYDS
jgi:hypothetical protein